MRTSRNIQFKFRKPSGSPARTPSKAMTAALHQIASSDEMKPLLNRARKAGRGVLIEVFQSRDGQPILIHTALLPRLGEQKESA